MTLKAPFPYFGGKSKIAPAVWAALGQPKHYIEPFFGSGAVFLSRPKWNPSMIETVNDADGFIANVWRGIQYAPDEVARWCDWPVNHADLNARRKHLIRNEGYLLKNLVDDPEWCDPKLAGYWIWAASCWIGSGLTRSDAISLLTSNTGINAGQIPLLAHAKAYSQARRIHDWMGALSNRLRRVRVVCGDWTRVCGGDWQDYNGVCGIFFDPPYSHDAGRDNAIYAVENDCASDVAKWAHERGQKPTYRIVISGYDGEHNWLELDGWRVIEWKANGGYGNRAGNKNRHRERLWLSPHCVGNKIPHQEALAI